MNGFESELNERRNRYEAELKATSEAAQSQQRRQQEVLAQRLELHPVVCGEIRDLARLTAPLLPKTTANARMARITYDEQVKTVNRGLERVLYGRKESTHTRSRYRPNNSLAWVLRSDGVDWASTRASGNPRDERSVYIRSETGLALTEEGELYRFKHKTSPQSNYPFHNKDKPLDFYYELEGELATDVDIISIEAVSLGVDQDGAWMDVASWKKTFLELIPR